MIFGKNSSNPLDLQKRQLYICFFLGIFIASIWGLNFIFIENAISQLPPILLVALRYFIVGIVFLPITRRNGSPWKYIFLLGFFSGVVQFWGLFWGLSLGVSSGVAATLMQSQALFTILLATLFTNERFFLIQWIGLFVGSFGLILIATGGDASAPLLGVLCVLMGGAGWACSNIVLKKAGKVSAWTMTVWQSIIVVPIMLSLSLLFESGQYMALTNITISGIASVIYISLLATGLGNFIWYYLIQQIGLANTAPFSLLVPVVAIISGWLFLGEKLSSIQIAGLVIALSAQTLLQLISYFKTMNMQIIKIEEI